MMLLFEPQWMHSNRVSLKRKVDAAGRICRERAALLVTATASLLVLVPAAAAGTPCYRFAPDFYDNGLALNTAPVCKALVRNFNEFCDEPPMACEFKIHPKYSRQLSQPNWKRISPTPSARDIERFVRSPEIATGKATLPGTESMWSYWQPKVEAAIQHGLLTVDEAQVDLLNSGHKDRVWRMRTGECSTKNRATSDSDHSLSYQTDGVHANFAPGVYLRYPKRGFSEGAGTVFTFNGSTYNYAMVLDRVIVNRSDDSTDQIIGRSKNVCAIQLVDKEPK